APGADQEIGFAGEQHDQREGTLQSAQRRGDRVPWRCALVEIARDQDGDGFGVGLRLGAIAQRRELGLQLLEILDDAVMHHRHAVGGDGMGIGLVGRAMRRPARMADAGAAGKRRRGEALRQPVELAFGAAPLDASTLDERRDPRGIISAIFEPPQPFDKKRRRRVASDDADDAAHQPLPLRLTLPDFSARRRSRHSAARFGFVTCGPRATAIASGGTSSVMTLPAAMKAPEPMLTGATSEVLVPTNTLSPISVRNFSNPS